MRTVVGLYDIPPNELSLARDAGADVVQWYGFGYIPNERNVDWLSWKTAECLSYMSKAYSFGLRVMCDVPRMWYTFFTVEKNRLTFIKAISSHPAFYAWYLADEPELDRIYAGKYTIENARLDVTRASQPKKADTRIATARMLKHFNYPYAEKYMCSAYRISPPIGSLGIAWMFLDWLFLAAKYGPDRVIPILQTHDIERFAQPVDSKRWRDPTRKEIECQVSLARWLDVGEIWFWGFHAEWGHDLYTLKDRARLELARDIIKKAHEDKYPVNGLVPSFA